MAVPNNHPLALIMKYASLQKWTKVALNRTTGEICLARGKDRAIVHFGRLGKLTITTCIDHPYQGVTVLYREDVYFPTLRAIMADPRYHSGRGRHKSVRTFEEKWEDLHRLSTVDNKGRGDKIK